MPLKQEEYNNFINDLEILNTTIPINSWHLHFFPTKQSKLQNEINLEILDPIFSKDRSQIIIPAKLNIKGKVKDDEKDFLEITIYQNLKIQVNPQLLTDELLGAYVKRNGILTIVSVFREQVKYATFQMGLPPLIIPTLKMAPRPTAQKKTTKKRKNHN